MEPDPRCFTRLLYIINVVRYFLYSFKIKKLLFHGEFLSVSRICCPIFNCVDRDLYSSTPLDPDFDNDVDPALQKSRCSGGPSPRPSLVDTIRRYAG